MGKQYDQLDDRLTDFIGKQKMFFVGTAPLDGGGHVNLSPKGYDSFTIIDETTVAYLDMGGSGIETQAPMCRKMAASRIMFCAFEGPAFILRLYGHGESVSFDQPEFPELLKLFPSFDKARAIIRIKLTRIQDSCGWAVPFYEFKEERDQLKRYGDHLVETGTDIAEKYYTNNATSIDGLPGLVRPEKGDTK